MSFEAGQYILNLNIPLPSAAMSTRGGLTRHEASVLATKLENDSQKLIYSSLLSIASALTSVEQGYTSWPAIKLYYSSFYAIRAILALSGVCLYYNGKKGLWIESIDGALSNNAPSNAKGSTHKFVFILYKNKFPRSPLLSQDIDGLAPFDWLMQKREEINYRQPRFIEPSESPLFRLVDKYGIRKLCIQYLEDESYAFDPDHAIISYPIYLMNHIRRLGVRGSSCVSNGAEDVAYEVYFSDRYGSLGPLIELKRALII